MQTATEIKLNNAPEDCIQNVRFSPTDARHLLASSWDCTVRLYDVKANVLKTQYTHDAPVMDATFENANTCWSGGVDCKIKRYDLQTQTETIVGQHMATVRCVEYNSDVGLVASGSWDSRLHFWDPRIIDASQKGCVGKHLLPDKVYSMTTCGTKVILGLAGRRIAIWDLRNMSNSVRESMLKYQIRCVEAFADQRGYVVSSIEGRIAVEYLDPSTDVQKQRYAFKCHRHKDALTDLEMVYPVNTISFHRKFNTFASGGSDGYVSIWDAQNKKRLNQFHKYPTSISSVSFSADGSSLAIACSYLYAFEDARSMRDTPPDAIYVRQVSEQEARNRGR